MWVVHAQDHNKKTFAHDFHFFFYHFFFCIVAPADVTTKYSNPRTSPDMTPYSSNVLGP